jgi:TRAP-type C4-dicarboxylate transport system permease small subunit
MSSKATETKTGESDAGGALRSAIRYFDEKLEEILILVLLTGVIALVAIELIRRVVFSNSTDWGVRIATYIYVWVSWIGASYAIKKRLHLKIEIVQSRLPRTIRYLVITVSNLLFAALIGMIAYYLIDVIQVQYETGSTMFGVPTIKKWYLYSAVPPALVLMIVRLFQNVVEDTKNFRAGEQFAESEALFIEE